MSILDLVGHSYPLCLHSSLMLFLHRKGFSKIHRNLARRNFQCVLTNCEMFSCFLRRRPSRYAMIEGSSVLSLKILQVLAFPHSHHGFQENHFPNGARHCFSPYSQPRLNDCILYLRSFVWLNTILNLLFNKFPSRWSVSFVTSDSQIQ